MIKADVSGEREMLGGWLGKSPRTVADVYPASDELQIDQLFERPAERGLIARGAGHSWGDAAQRAGGTVVRTTAMNRVLAFDQAEGVVDVQAGMSLGELMRVVVPAGWLPAVLPTTRFVTVGGAIAADIHGRNQHCDGNFAHHVLSMRLRTPAETLTLTPQTEPDLFWATVGGMGLTGVILDASLRLIRVETGMVRVWAEAAPNLDALMTRLTDPGSASRYSVAWLDPLSTGRALGRGVIVRGEHATGDELGSDGRSDSLRYSPTPHLRLPRRLPGLLRGNRVRALNELVHRRAVASQGRQRFHSLGAFFHVHDHLDSWMSLSGPPGFVEYQFVLPPQRADLIREVIERLLGRGMLPFFAVLKRFERRTDGRLSFPAPGWMAALDLRVQPGLPGVLDELDELVAEAGGRVYLAKDARMKPAALAAMYPGLEDLRRARERHDPRNTMRSDLAVRLQI